MKIIINRLLDFYYDNKKEINQTIDVFLFETLSSKITDLEDTIDLSGIKR